MDNIGRRNFLKKTAATALGASFLTINNPLASLAENIGINPIPKRPLGKTGHNVSIVSLGGLGAIRHAEKKEEAIAIVNRALDLGINYIDTAEGYSDGVSESHIGEVMKTRRNEVFLATKIRQRTQDGIEERFEKSCERLQTDFIDLYFMHGVHDTENLHAVLDRSNGAVKVFERLRDNGRIGHIGISSHSTDTLEKALELYDFDCVFLTINPSGRSMNENPKKTREFLKKTAEKDVGVVAMKLTAQTAIFEYDINMKECLQYALSAGYNGDKYPICTANIGISNVAQVDENVRLASQFKPCNEAELDRMEYITQVR